MACGHRCELHEQGGTCQAVECGCPAWIGEEDGDGGEGDEIG
jgi:hypothetical protein